MKCGDRGARLPSRQPGSGPWTARGVRRLACVVAFEIVAAGCASTPVDECSIWDPDRCDGNVAVHCFESGDSEQTTNVLLRTDCGAAHCLLAATMSGPGGNPAAYCAVSETPDPRCDGTANFGSFCVGNTFGACEDHHITGAFTCRGSAVCESEFRIDGFSRTPVCLDSSNGIREECAIQGDEGLERPFSPVAHCCASRGCYDCHPGGTCSP